jgi:hypothetical protein
MKTKLDWKQRHQEENRQAEAILAKYEISQPSCGFYVGLGWIPIVDKALGDMIAAGWNKGLAQVKSKFCTLRIYIDGSTPEIDAIIGKAEAACALACENCGQPHELNVPMSGVALCKVCREEE